MLRYAKLLTLLLLVGGSTLTILFQVDRGALPGQMPGPTPYCGDGHVDPGEDCDDGNMQSGDGCDMSCQDECILCESTGIMGCSVPASGSECDNADQQNVYNFNDMDTCVAECYVATCGNGVVDEIIGEVCDSPRCSDGSACGPDNPCPNNGQCVNRAEYGCSMDCMTKYCVLCESYMAYSCMPTQPLGTVCDNSKNMYDTITQCEAACQAGEDCGNGALDADEDCDNGEQNSDTEPDACRTSCKRAHCGDGVKDSGEDCDGSEGCSYECTCKYGARADGTCNECSPTALFPEPNGCFDGLDCTEDLCLSNGTCAHPPRDCTPDNPSACYDYVCMENSGLSSNEPGRQGCVTLPVCEDSEDECINTKCKVENNAPVCYEEDVQTEECLCGENRVLCPGPDRSGDPKCCREDRCEERKDDDCVDTCNEERKDAEGRCAQDHPDDDPDDPNDRSDAAYQQCLDDAADAWNTCVEGCGDGTWYCRGGTLPQSSPPSYPYNPPQRPIVGIGIGTNDTDGNAGGGGSTGDPKDRKCSSGTICRDNRCIAVVHCTTVGEPMDLDYECSGFGNSNSCVTGTSSSASSQSSRDEYMCCGGCIKIGEPFDGICASPAYSLEACEQACGGDNPTHTECIEDTCTEVSGEGDDSCSSDDECLTETHGVCHGSTCAQEPGTGPNLCTKNADCENTSHLACKNGQCISVPGGGRNLCDDVLGCGTGQHLECRNNACAVVSGDGAHQCNQDIGCNQHSICDGNACRIVDGPGDNECSTPADCLRTSSSSASSHVVEQSSSSLSSSNSSSTQLSISSSSTIIAQESSASSTSSSSLFVITQESSFSSTTLTSEISSSQSTSGTGDNGSTTGNANAGDAGGTEYAARSATYVAAEEEDVRFLTPNSPCGNTFLNANEECDDGNTRNGDGCSSTCQLETEDPQVCSANTECSSGSCTEGKCTCTSESQCSQNSRCIGGVCTQPTVRLVAAASICGNGTLENGEECDDSNRRDNDGCSTECLLEIGICGDGIVQKLLGEQCEQVSHDKTLPYSCVRCRFVSSSCGDGKIDPGEECDAGTLNSTQPDANCRPDCSFGRCGDAVQDASELCDDGNRVSGDGCDRFCRTESTVVAADTAQDAGATTQDIAFPNTMPNNNPTLYQFPYAPTGQALPYQLPLAQLQPLMQAQGPIGDTGPAAVAVIGAGAAGGVSWVRRKKK